jgi:alpha,alpha-trehalase
VELGQLVSHELGTDYFTVTMESSLFASLALGLRDSINKHLWNPEAKTYSDLNCKTGEQTGYKSATSIYALWSGVASKEQAALFVPEFISLFLERGGISSGTQKSRGVISKSRPQRQWDYPFGWAPHQMMAWRGLSIYGFHREAGECAYRWCFAITKNFTETGIVPEKFNVVTLKHRDDVEYGTQGDQFEVILFCDW